jgi:hypothetical protein
MAGRKSLPHTPPLSIDPAREIWFITICCTPRGENQLARPDHAHALLSFPPDRPMRKTVADWKHWTAAKAGVAWQIDFFDHRLRREESFEQKAAYIAENPVRAGLAGGAAEWRYVWRAPGIYTGLHR